MTVLHQEHPLHKRLKEIQEQAASAQFMVEIVFTHAANKEFAVELELLHRIDLFTNFGAHFMDYMEVTGNVNVIQYKNLLKYFNDLKANFSMFYYDEEKNTKGKLFFKETFSVLLHQIRDVSHGLPQLELYDPKKEDNEMTAAKRGQMVDLKFQLIREDAYKLAKLRMNTLLPDATVEQALWTFCEALKINRCCIIKPDETQKFPTIELTPMLGLDNVFTHLQKKYGVYDHDGCLYYHNGILYIYPLFVTEGRSDDTFHIYRAPVGYLLGSKGTTIFEGKDAFMFTNQLTQHKVTATQGVEECNSVFSINSANLYDNWVQHEEGASTLSKDNGEIYNASLSKGAIGNTHTPRWRPNPNNNCLVKSGLAKLNVSVLDISWTAALPFVIKPFQKMMFHYEKDDKIASVSATCPSVAYTFTKQARLEKPIFSIIANMKIFIPNSTDAF